MYVLESILEKLVTELSKIGDSRYGTWEVGPVKVDVRRFESTGKGTQIYPSIFVTSGEDSVKRTTSMGTSSLLEVSSDISIDVLLKDYGGDSVLSLWKMDLLKVLHTDPKLGGVCRDSSIVRMTSYTIQETKPLLGLAVEFQVKYRFLETNPSTLL